MSDLLRGWSPFVLAMLLVALLLGLPLLLWACEQSRDDPVDATEAAADWVPSDELCLAADRRTGEPEFQAYQAYLDRYHPEGDGPKYDVWIGLTVPQACAERAR